MSNKELVQALTVIRNDLVNSYQNARRYIDDEIKHLDMILRLNQEIRTLNIIIKYNKD